MSEDDFVPWRAYSTSVYDSEGCFVKRHRYTLDECGSVVPLDDDGPGDWDDDEDDDDD